MDAVIKVAKTFGFLLAGVFAGTAAGLCYSKAFEVWDAKIDVTNCL